MRTRFLPMIVAALIIGVAGACDENTIEVEPGLEPPELPAMERDGVRAAIVLEGRNGDELTLAVYIQALDLALGSYQGRITMDEARVELVGAQAPQGSDGFRIANASEPAEGLRFAGFTTRGFESPVALRFVVRAPDGIGEDALSVELEVAGTLEGAVVERPRYQTPHQLYRTSTPAGR